ncbi:hypothetical protein AB6A40_001819 [Gnathostoma spinigerum]|uniref:Uncharacterized protein n=1 Tax=Gnathostoma spinigerum TaxID=75299 RepID=A0ABD6E541_9BILA
MASIQIYDNVVCNRETFLHATPKYDFKAALLNEESECDPKSYALGSKAVPTKSSVVSLFMFYLLTWTAQHSRL